MGWKRSLNETLQRVTGARLTRETAEQRDAATTQTARVATRRARRATAQRYRRRIDSLTAKHARQLARQEERRRDQLTAHCDDETRRIITAVRPRTMTDPPKLHALIEATRFISRNEIPGDVVECGVWRGGSMQAVAFTLAGLGDTARQLHLFDTFEGMTSPTEHDVRARDGETAVDLLAAHERDARIWALADLVDVREGMAEVPYPADKISYHPGMVEVTLPDQAPDRIALLRLDTDWYESTKHELEHLYHRLSPGGILILDDYGDWDGARKATEEWLSKTGISLFLAPMGTGRIAVKAPDR